MKNLGTLSTCLIMLIACSTPSVEVIKLSNGDKGYDLNCLGSLGECKKKAKVLCEDGKYRIHNTYSNSLSLIQNDENMVMRLQCLEEQASLDQCSLPGVSCVL